MRISRRSDKSKKDGLTQDEINNLQVQIEQISGVNKPIFNINQSWCFSTVRTQLGDKQDLLTGWDGENNPFPASFILRCDLKVKVNQCKILFLTME